MTKRKLSENNSNPSTLLLFFYYYYSTICFWCDIVWRKQLVIFQTCERIFACLGGGCNKSNIGHCKLDEDFYKKTIYRNTCLWIVDKEPSTGEARESFSILLSVWIHERVDGGHKIKIEVIKLWVRSSKWGCQYLWVPESMKAVSGYKTSNTTVTCIYSRIQHIKLVRSWYKMGLQTLIINSNYFMYTSVEHTHFYWNSNTEFFIQYWIFYTILNFLYNSPISLPLSQASMAQELSISVQYFLPATKKFTT